MTFLWIIDAITLLAAIYFFGKALPAATAPDTTFFVGWLLLITIPCVSIAGSYWLNVYGYPVLAFLSAAVPAVPSLLYMLLMILLLYPEPNARWSRVQSV